MVLDSSGCRTKEVVARGYGVSCSRARRVVA